MSGLEQGKRHAVLRSSLEAEQIDLGNEPPLSVDGESTGVVDRRRVSVQWLSGHPYRLCGAAYEGAVFAASMVRPTSPPCRSAWKEPCAPPSPASPNA
jgi:hypothetical protein